MKRERTKGQIWRNGREITREEYTLDWSQSEVSLAITIWCKYVCVQFVFMDSMEASGMMGMEQVRSSSQMNTMRQQTPQTMMQYNGLSPYINHLF